MGFHLHKILSQFAQIIFLRPKQAKTKTSRQNRENVFLLIRMTQEKQKTKAKYRRYRLGSLFQVESGKVDLSECSKLSVDESLVAPDPDMFGYRTFVVI